MVKVSIFNLKWIVTICFQLLRLIEKQQHKPVMSIKLHCASQPPWQHISIKLNKCTGGQVRLTKGFLKGIPQGGVMGGLARWLISWAEWKETMDWFQYRNNMLLNNSEMLNTENLILGIRVRYAKVENHRIFSSDFIQKSVWNKTEDGLQTNRLWIGEKKMEPSLTVFHDTSVCSGGTTGHA